MAGTTGAPRSKRERIADLLDKSGASRLAEALPRRECLYVVNYHRIGDPEHADGDPEVFSATAEEFDAQVAMLKQRHRIITLDEAMDFVEGKPNARSGGVLLTFDDGYLDNYEIAYPILARHGVQATFFLATSLVGSNTMPWWDALAHMLRNTTQPQFELTYPQTQQFDTAARPWSEELKRILAIYKAQPDIDQARFLEGVAQATGVDDYANVGRRFLDYAEAREMLAGGMAIGSHSVSHNIMSQLPADRQRSEVAQSRRILSEELGAPIDAFAYPVGARSAFTADTVHALNEENYRIAFSFYGGANPAGRVHPFDVRREFVPRSLSVLRAETMWAMAPRPFASSEGSGSPARPLAVDTCAHNRLESSVHDYFDWPQLVAHWHALTKRSGETLKGGDSKASFFTSGHWVDNWMAIFGPTLRPHIVVMRDGSEVVAIALLTERRSRQGPIPVTQMHLNASGEPEADSTTVEFNDLVCMPEYRARALEELVTVARSFDWDELAICGLDDEVTHDFEQAAGRLRHRKETSASPYVDLAKLQRENLSYLSQLSTNTRAQARRSHKRLESEFGRLQLRPAASTAQALDMLDKLAELHQASWNARGEAGVFSSQLFTAFHRRLIANTFDLGLVELLEISAGDERVGVLYNFRYRGKVYFYQSGLMLPRHKHQRPGITSHILAIEHYLAQGLREYDFLAGQAQYKTSLATDSRDLHWLVIENDTPKSATMHLLRRLDRRYPKLAREVKDFGRQLRRNRS